MEQCPKPIHPSAHLAIVDWLVLSKEWVIGTTRDLKGLYHKDLNPNPPECQAFFLFSALRLPGLKGFRSKVGCDWKAKCM